MTDHPTEIDKELAAIAMNAAFRIAFETCINAINRVKTHTNGERRVLAEAKIRIDQARQMLPAAVAEASNKQETKQ